LLHADSAEQRQLNQYLAIEARVEAACRSDVDSELCQVWLHGMQQGVEAVALQTEQLSARWALTHERGEQAHPRAWLTRDVLNAASCSPDALAFVSSFRQEEGADWNAGQEHVARMCGPIWSAQRLEPTPSSQVSALNYE
jgi:hypothetical protein